MNIIDWLSGVTTKDKLRAEAERTQFLAEQLKGARARGDRHRELLIAAENERDATTKQLEETTRDLVEARRKYGALSDGFDELAAVLRRVAGDKLAAEQLLDEAGGQIAGFRGKLSAAFSLYVAACKESDGHKAKLNRIDDIVSRSDRGQVPNR